MVTDHKETHSEEIVNSITHGLGAVVSAVGLVALAQLCWHRPLWVLLSTCIFCATLTLMFAASSLYHGCRCPHTKPRLHKLDLVAIYCLIAGTYTPYCILGVPGIFGKVMLVLVWLLSMIGCLFTLMGGHRFPSITLPMYLFLGWMALLIAPSLVHSLPSPGFAWLVTGGISYTVGSVFYATHWFRFSHAVWHLFVIAGGACHYWSIWLAAQVFR